MLKGRYKYINTYKLISNTHKFANHDEKNFILLLWKRVSPYDYMDDWEKFNETLLPEMEDF